MRRDARNAGPGGTWSRKQQPWDCGGSDPLPPSQTWWPHPASSSIQMLWAIPLSPSVPPNPTPAALPVGAALTRPLLGIPPPPLWPSCPVSHLTLQVAPRGLLLLPGHPWLVHSPQGPREPAKGGSPLLGDIARTHRPRRSSLVPRLPPALEPDAGRSQEEMLLRGM